MMPFDSRRFHVYQPNFPHPFSVWGDYREFDECLAFLNEHGQDLLRSGPLQPLGELHRVRLVDPTRTRLSIIREITTTQIVGTAMLKISYDWRKVVGDVEYVLVAKEFRGGDRGLGRALMEHLLGQAREVGVTLVNLQSRPVPERERARHLYTHLGFTLVGTSDRHFELKLS